MATRLTEPTATGVVTAEPAQRQEDAALRPLLNQLTQDSAALVKQEINLAKAELSTSVKQTAAGATRVAAGAAIGGVAGLVLTAFLVLLLGDLLGNYWLAALIVGVVFAAVGGLLAMAGLKRFREMKVAPERTIETLREDAAWAKQEVNDLKRELRT